MRDLLLIRVDTNVHIGTGHLMRCLALAQGWQSQGGRALFVLGVSLPSLEARLQAEGMEVVHLALDEKELGSLEDAHQLLVLAKEQHPLWIVLDGYHFGPEYQRAVKEAGFKLLVIDDMAHHEHYYADIVLNQNLHADQLEYSCEPYTRLLLGTKYVLLRQEFWKWRGWNRIIPEVARKVLVTMGGSDPHNITLKVVKALNFVKIDGLEAVVVVGMSNSNQRFIEEAIKGVRIPIELVTNADNMAELMAWADLAVSSGGSTCWELAFMGTPSVLIVAAENQRPIAGSLHHKGAAVSMGWHGEVDVPRIAGLLTDLLASQEWRRSLFSCSRRLMNGYNGLEVVRELLRDIKADQFLL